MALFGQDQSSTTGGNSATRRTTDQLQKTREGNTQQTGTKSGAKTEQKQVQFDEATLKALQDIIPVLTAGASGPAFDVTQLVETQKAEETRKFEDDTMRQINRIAQKTGSRDNSFVPQLIAEGREDLAVRLAALGTQLTLQGNNVAGETQSNKVLDLARIAQTLKGGTSTVSGTSNAETAETVNKLIEALTGTTNELEENTSGTQAQSGNKSRDLIDLIGSFGGLLD